MKIVADESVDKQIVERLRVDGHDVLFVAELDPGEAISERKLAVDRAVEARVSFRAVASSGLESWRPMSRRPAELREARFNDYDHFSGVRDVKMGLIAKANSILRRNSSIRPLSCK